ncbi:30S ribosomal protein S19e [Nanoarchaeota archaeon]
MTNTYDVDQTDLVEATANSLKNVPEIKAPDWAAYVKTGHYKDRPPVNQDWWYFRTAAILRRVMILGPVGVSKLRTKFGGKKNRGVRPEKRYKASGNIIRKVLQQLEKAELIKKAEKGNHKGRIISPKGISLINKAAATLRSPKKAETPKNG